MDDNMNDDFNTAKVLANIFEIVSSDHSIKDKHISVAALSVTTLRKTEKIFPGLPGIDLRSVREE